MTDWTQKSILSTARAVNTENAHVKESTRATNLNDKLATVKQSALQHLNAIPHLTDADNMRIQSEFGNTFADAFIAGYKPSRLLGEGRYGTVFAACADRYRCIAVKIQLLLSETDFKRELRMQQKFASLSLAPTIVSDPRVFINGKQKFAVLSMNTIDGNMETLLTKELPMADLHHIVTAIIDMIALISNTGMTHGDFSTVNLGFKYTNDAWSQLTIRPILIDFGWATDEFSYPQWDTLQFMRTSLPERAPDMNAINRTFILNKLMAFYNANWAPKLLRHADVETVFNSLSEAYKQRVENPVGRPLTTVTRSRSRTGKLVKRVQRRRQRVRSFFG